MTVSYQYDVASSSTGGFFRLLWRWRGSIWKLLYKELLLFVAVYMCIAFTYDFLMTDYYKKYYEHIVIFCSAFVEVIPLSFILGFYVSFTATRWWQQYTAIPWPDKLMNIIALYIPGNDVTSRVLRRTLMRYLNLTLVLVLRSISIPVKRRFPTKEHLVEAGFMSRPELEIYQSVPSHEFNTFWIPCTWFVNLLREAKSECRITDSGGIKLIMEEFNEFRSKCGLLWSYDWVSIPLVYTQVVTLSTQAFFLASLLGRQHINSAKPHVYGEYYIPIFTMLQFILYMGLLKLGEQLINPFGDDDEDFELNWIIDRHLKVSFLGVDILNSDPPPLIKDNYFDETDIKLPYTEAAVAHKVKTYRGSVAAFHVPTDKHGLVIPEFEDENDVDSDDDPSTIQSNRDAVARNNSWSLFSPRKRKLSSSLDSFNSELMVETGGLSEESELPELVQTNSSWPTFLQSEQQRHQQTTIIDNKEIRPTTTMKRNTSSVTSLSSKLSVWPMQSTSRHQEQRKANEDTQGIRSENEGHKNQEEFNNDVGDNKNSKQQQQQSVDTEQQPALYKQSSLCSTTSDSSIAIAMGDTTYQWPNQNIADKIYRPCRKLPLQVFSKEMANAPISVFNQILESNLRRQSKNSSLSSLGSTTTTKAGDQISIRTSFRPVNRPMIKSSRHVDPKLRIRPFRSKVTFSDDTKNNDDNTLQVRNAGRGFHQYHGDSSSESNSSLMRFQQDMAQQPSQHSKLRSKHTSSTVIQDSKSKTFSIQKSLQDSGTFFEKRKRRQSMDPTIYHQRDKTILLQDPEINQDNWLHYQSLPNIQEEDQQIVGLLTLHDTNPSSTIPTASDSLAIEIPDEDLKLRLSSSQQTPVNKMIIIKQSSSESQGSSSNSSSNKGITMMPPPPGILKKRNETIPIKQQASTESDTGIPKIIFSQSTPSVTSQSSDDQNSPKWDSERYSQFSESMETVVIQQQQQQHNTITDPNQTLRIQRNNNNKQTSTTNNNLSSTIEDDLMAKSNHKSVPSSSIVFDSAASSSSSSSLSSNPLESSLPTQQSSSLTIRKC
ncbi:chloride channel forming protein [Dermatophagoides pteronyssinus]|uniref:Chloride channel forming protein n=1 Tax=Dermatophagoides pteronyssinus TaxID=6956 RepID=A0ABQ8JRF3_DERPT|nr:chloride channel forming protein [Dermatophagoides pteronyssinus]